MRFVFIALLIALNVDARPRLVRRPAPDDAVHYRGDATRAGVLATHGPQTFSRIAWQTNVGPVSFTPPLFAYGTLYVSTGNGRVIALDAATGAQRWSSPILGDFTSVPLVTRDAIYVGSESRQLHKLNPATGAIEWSFSADHWAIGSPALANGTLYFGTEAGSFYAIDAATRMVRWRVSLAQPIHASPVVADGVVFVYVGSRIVALDAASGAERWRRELDTGIWLAMTWSDGRIFAAAAGGALYALGARDGDVVWRLDPPPDVSGWSFIAALNGLLFASNDARNVVALEQATGRIRWTFPTTSVPTEPMIAGAAVYIGAGSRVHAIESATGAPLWSAVVPGELNTGPAIGDGRVYFMTGGGVVVAME